MPNNMLIITLGDPFSINIELLQQCMPELIAQHMPIVLAGDFFQFEQQWQRLTLQAPKVAFLNPQQTPSTGLWFAQNKTVFNGKKTEELTPLERGTISFEALQAVQAISRGVDKFAVLTCPVDKKNVSLCAPNFCGQTEFFSEMWQAKSVMTLAADNLRVGLATNHLALSEVPVSLTTPSLVEKILTFTTALTNQFGIPKPRVAICGLNPHCSDQGLFGDEEETIITPAIEAARLELPHATLAGPVPADTVFHLQHFDGILAMYHDQGLAPFKALHFDDGINVSCGLPHLRLSPDHGTAQDIYMLEKANPRSMKQCLKFLMNYFGVIDERLHHHSRCQ